MQKFVGRLLAADVIAALAMVCLVFVAASEQDGAVLEPMWLSWVIAVVVAGPIAFRRRWPLSSLAVAMGASVATILLGFIPSYAMAAPLTAVAVVLYLVAYGLSYRGSGLALASCVVAFAVAAVLRQAVAPVNSWGDTLVAVGFGSAVLTFGWLIGITAQLRRMYADQAVAQATRQAVAEERLRIARELHDIVAHSMSLIAVKAGIGNHVAESRPEEAREALRVIESTSRESMAEIRSLLGVLRSDVDKAALAPTPGLAAVGELVVQAADAGVAVTLELPEADLPEGVGLSVYRIVQEAMTNVVRHVGPTSCHVRVEPTEQDVQVEVVNEGPVVRPGPRLGGHGLIGMRERVAMYGGTFAAGPRKEGGFRVAATIPYSVS